MHGEAAAPFLAREAWHVERSLVASVEEDKGRDIVVDRDSHIEDRAQDIEDKVEVAAFDHNMGSSFVHLQQGCRDATGEKLLQDVEEEVRRNSRWVDDWADWMPLAMDGSSPFRKS